MKRKKKIFALLLSAVTVLSMITCMPYNALADNVDFSTVQNIGIDEFVSGSFNGQEKEYLYSFNLKNSGKIEFSGRTDGLGTYNFCYMQIFDSLKKEIYNNSIKYDSNFGYGRINQIIYLKSGHYYIRLSSNYTIDYRFSFSFTDSGESFKESITNNDDYVDYANPIKTNKKYYGQLGINDEADIFKFKLDVDSRVKVSFHGGEYLFGHTLDSRGNEIYRYFHAADNDCYELKKGTYYLRIIDSVEEELFYDFTIVQEAIIGDISSVSISGSSISSVKAKWSKVSGAKGYQIQIKKGNKYDPLVTVSKNEYTIKKLSPATSYSLRVRPYVYANEKSHYGKWKTFTITTKPKTPSVKSVKSKKKGQVQVALNKTSSSGYQIQYSDNKKFSRAKSINVASKSSKITIKKLKSKKKYYVRVRAYKSQNKTKYYSSWLSAKAVKVK